jgi:cell division protein FtsB
MTYEKMDVPFNKILSIKELADQSFLGGPKLQKAFATLKDLGEQDGVSATEMHAAHDLHASALLVRAEGMIDKIVRRSEEQNAKSMVEMLGESDSEMFPKMEVRKPHEIATTIEHVVQYLTGIAKNGAALSQSQIQQARKWYLDSTAVVLGRYAYEDQKADLDKKDDVAFDSLKGKAESVKQSMDKVDAAEHLRQLGARKWMDHSGLDIVHLLQKTGHLAQFLSEIEAEVKRHHHRTAPQVSEVQKLKAREEDITNAINQLLHNVEKGDPITQTASKVHVPAHAGDTQHEQQLLGKLMVAADKEDKARIVEAAGEVAQKQISGVMDDTNKDIKKKHAQLAALKEKAQESKEKAQDAEDKANGITVVHDAVPMVETDDLNMPLGGLHRRVQDEVNKHLNLIQSLFHKRNEQKKRLSLKDYKVVNSHLRTLAARLMQKYADKDQEQPYMLRMPLAKALQMPLRDAAWMRKASEAKRERARDAKLAKSIGHVPIHKMLQVPLRYAKNMYEKPKIDPQTTGELGLKKEQTVAPEKKATDVAPKKATDVAPKKKATDVAPKKEDKPKNSIPIHELLKVPLHKAKALREKHPEDPNPKKKTRTPQPAQQPAAKEAPKRDPVTQFVYHTLGPSGVSRIQNENGLAGLLKSGLRMATGGFLRFATPLSKKHN